MKPPVRWLDDPTLADDLRADLECVKAHAWQPDLARAAASLEVALSAEPTASDASHASATHTAAGTGTLTAKLTIAAVSGGLVLTAGIWQLQQASEVPKPAPIATAPASQEPAAAESRSRREIEQLRRIYATLERDPAQAYRLARASLADIPHGPLREEREGLAVIALWQSGDHPAARALAQRFLARFPQSPLRERIRALLASEASP